MAFFDFETIKDKAIDLAQTGVSKSKQIEIGRASCRERVFILV